jgi:hypothetical protein
MAWSSEHRTKELCRGRSENIRSPRREPMFISIHTCFVGLCAGEESVRRGCARDHQVRRRCRGTGAGAAEETAAGARGRITASRLPAVAWRPRGGAASRHLGAAGTATRSVRRWPRSGPPTAPPRRERGKERERLQRGRERRRGSAGTGGGGLSGGA